MVIFWINTCSKLIITTLRIINTKKHGSFLWLEFNYMKAEEPLTGDCLLFTPSGVSQTLFDDVTNHFPNPLEFPS